MTIEEMRAVVLCDPDDLTTEQALQWYPLMLMANDMREDDRLDDVRTFEPGLLILETEGYRLTVTSKVEPVHP